MSLACNSRRMIEEMAIEISRAYKRERERERERERML